MDAPPFLLTTIPPQTGTMDVTWMAFIQFICIAFQTYVAGLCNNVSINNVVIPQLVSTKLPLKLVAYALHTARVMAQAYTNPGPVSPSPVFI